MSERFVWLQEKDLPKGARVIQAKTIVVDWEAPDHPLMNEYPIHAYVYLIDMDEYRAREVNL